MTHVFALGIALRVSFLLGLALGSLRLLRGASASLRRCIALLGVCASLGAPLFTIAFPGRPVVHLASTALVGHVVAEALSPSRASIAPPASLPARPESPPLTLSPSAWLWLIWAAGALLVATRVGYGALRAFRLCAAARPSRPARSGVRISDDIEMPVVAGVFRPIVLLPVASRTWSEERLRAVLLHEFSHVHRLDGLALLLAQLVCALYWFNPLAWLARARLRSECELAADEAAIAGGFRPSRYAQHLLEIARGTVPAGVIAMAAPRSELSRRIYVLLGRDHLPAPLTPTRAALLGLVTVSVLASVACVETGNSTTLKESSARSPTSGDPGRDERLQRIADEEARRTRGEWGAERVAIVVLDPSTGALLANSDDAPGKAIVPASTLKPITVAAALDAEAISPEQRFDCGSGTRNYGSLVLRDAGSYGSLNAAEVLAVSSNIGVSRIFDALGGERLGDGLRRFRLAPPAEIPSASFRGAIIAMGEGITSTPVAMAAAYGVLANEGVLVKTGSAPERVIKASTAKTVLTMLEGAVSGDRATGKAAAIAGARVGGKTGTSDDADCEACAQGGGRFVSFVGIVPIDAPRWVIYVGVGKPNKPGSGGTIAAPAFSRVATRALGLPSAP